MGGLSIVNVLCLFSEVCCVTSILRCASSDFRRVWTSALFGCGRVAALTADPKQPASSLSTALYSVKSARQFVAFSELLHRLLLEDVLWWTPGRQQSFALLKRSVAESPIT